MSSESRVPHGESKASSAPESKTPVSRRIGPDPEAKPGPQPFPHQVAMRGHADEKTRQKKFTPAEEKK